MKSVFKKIFYPTAVIYNGSLTSLQTWPFRIFLGLVFLSFLFLYFMLPVWFIPGNDIAFQFSLMSNLEITLLVILSFLTSLLITMQIFLFTRLGRRAFADGGTGVLSGIGATVVGVAGCVGCSIGIVFGFLGIGAVIFLVQYQYYIASGAILVFLAALFLMAYRIEGKCKECEVPE